MPQKNYNDLPDTIGIKEYMEWRQCGRATADAVFHGRDFPKIPNQGKLMADKRAVLLYELGLSKEDKSEVLKEIAREIIKV